MSLRLGAVLLALTLAAGLPIQASADDRSDAIMAAKGFDFEGDNSPPDLVDENSMPTVGDTPGTAVSTESPVRRRGVQVNNRRWTTSSSSPTRCPSRSGRLSCRSRARHRLRPSATTSSSALTIQQTSRWCSCRTRRSRSRTASCPPWAPPTTAGGPGRRARCRRSPGVRSLSATRR
jgi:hypothetical protein